METSNRIRNLVIIILIAVLVIGGAYFWYSLRSPAKPTVNNNQPSSSLPSIGNKGGSGGGTTNNNQQGTGNNATNDQGLMVNNGLREIVKKDLLAPTVSSDGTSLLYILRESGHVASNDFDGANEQSLVNLTILETFDAIWPKDTKRVLERYSDKGTIKSFLNSVASSTVSSFLPNDTVSASFSPDGKSIAYIEKRASDSVLVIADAGNKSPKIVYTTPVADFTATWVAQKTILLVSRPSGVAPSLVLTLDTVSKKITPILNGTRGVVVVAAPDGSGFAFSQSDANGNAMPLALYSFKTGTVQSLNALTIADKCGFSLDLKTLFCGVPKNGIASPSPDMWYRGAISFTDSVVAIDLATNQTTTLIDSSTGFSVDVLAPFQSPDRAYLFFQNKSTESLWKLNLGTATQ